jgi:acetylglutamate kinase
VKILAKVGGAQLEKAAARTELARAVASARAAGHEIVLVHGGGNQIRELSRKLGLADRYHEGLRVTDAATADVVLMVLAGLVNKELVAALESQRVRAAGLCGADGSTFTAAKHRRDGADLGYVGVVRAADPSLVEALLAHGFVPVIATAAPLARGEDAASDHFYNINADLAAGPLARAFDADVLLFLTDVVGVLDADEQRIARLTPERCAELRANGVISGGMIPKVDAALAALAEHPRALVKIASAAGDDAIVRALDESVGTTFRIEPESAREPARARATTAPARASAILTPERASATNPKER